MRKMANVLLGVFSFTVLLVSCLYLFGYGLTKLEISTLRLDQVFFAGAFSGLVSNLISELVTSKFFK